MLSVVTGAAGHAGANLVRALIARGRPVRVLIHQDTRAIEGLDVEIFRGDVCDPDSLLKAFAGADIVYHLAARISIANNEWHRLEAINIKGVRNVVEACLNQNVRRLVHFSSIHAIAGASDGRPVDESTSLAADGHCPPYDRSKAAGEQEVRRGIEKGLDAVIVAPTAIIGPYDYKPSHFGEALIKMASGRLPALVGGGFDWVDARDVAEGAILAGDKAKAGEKFLLSGHWVSICDMAALVERITGVPAPGFICPLWLAGAAAPLVTTIDRLCGRRSLYTRDMARALGECRDVSHSKATRRFGYNPRPFEETIADTISWFMDNGQIKSIGGKRRHPR